MWVRIISLLTGFSFEEKDRILQTMYEKRPARPLLSVADAQRIQSLS